MDENYLDTHICLGCRQTIVGLDAYIQHKKYDCAVLKSKDLPKKSAAEPPLVQKNNTSDVHFGCDDFTSVATSSLPNSGDFRNIAQPSAFASLTPTWFEDIPSSVNNSQPLASEIVPLSTTVPAISTSGQSSVDLVDLLTTQNCSFFSSLQLKSKSTGGQPQPEFKSIENVTLPEYSANRDIGCVSSFLQQSKQLEHLCALTSPELKIEAADLFSTDAPNSDQQKNGQNGHLDLYDRTKVVEDSMTYGWKNNVSESNTMFNQPKTSDSSVLPERKEDMNDSFDHSKALRIACMFNNLELESDSDDFMPSDADDLLNFSDMDDEQNGFSHSHGDGKVVRERNIVGGKLDAYSRSQGKVLRPRKEQCLQEKNSSKIDTRSGKQIATKWRPGERPAVLPRYHPHTSRGKWQGPEGEDAEEEEEEDGEQDEQDEETDVEEITEKGREEEEKEKKRSHRRKQLTEFNCQKKEKVRCQAARNGKTKETCKKLGRKVKEKPVCKSCKKTFASHQSLEHHLKTVLHRKRTQLQSLDNESEQTQPVRVTLECPLCDKVFHSKYSFARHLLTPMHARRAQYNEKHKLIASTGLEAGVQLLMQRLQPFQCRICSFHTSEAEELMTHLKTSEHNEHVITLCGPFICMRCQYTCQNNDDMIAHVSSVEHMNVVKASFQPCVLKEKRCKITCPDCDMVINSTTQLANHQKTCKLGINATNNRQPNDKLQPLKCAHCEAVFLNRFNLTVHVRRLHRKEKSFQCRRCDKVFGDDRSLKLHRQSKHRSDAVKTSLTNGEAIPDAAKVENGSELNVLMHKCKQCDFTSDTLSDVITHRMSHVPSDCAICGLRFAKSLDHDKHMMSRQHRKKEEELKVSSGDSFTCDKCPRKFYTIRSLKLHEMNHQYASGKMPKNTGCDPDDIEVRCRKLIRESKLVNGKLECPECGKYLSKIGILPHLRAHAGVFPFQCTYCSKKFVDGNIMKRHLKVHLGIRSYNCKFCPREFDRRLTLDTHLMREHKDSAGIVASHLCNICGHKFLQLNQLNAHLKFHDKTVRCPQPGCLLTFRYQSEMLIHMQVHTKETRFLCDECGYAGKTKTQLSRHRRVHTGERRYKCSHCSYGAKHIANLTRHERVHTGNKPYQCPYCKYSCNTQENLRKHILKTKRHAGKPVYPCPKCEFGCNSASEFQNHMELVHSVPRTHLPSMVAGLYRRETDMQSPPQNTTIDQCLSGLVT